LSETALVRSILRTLQMKGVFCWRSNSGGVLVNSGSKKPWMFRAAPSGTPDIIGTVPAAPGQEPTGRLFGLEVKTETGRVLATQQRWHDKAAKHGVRVAVVRSVGEAVRVVEEWSKG
jgi:hypothetical protein